MLLRQKIESQTSPKEKVQLFGIVDSVLHPRVCEFIHLSWCRFDRRALIVLVHSVRISSIRTRTTLISSFKYLLYHPSRFGVYLIRSGRHSEIFDLGNLSEVNVCDASMARIVYTDIGLVGRQRCSQITF